MTPRRCQFGAKDVSGRISKIGDRRVPTVLHEAASIILSNPGGWTKWSLFILAMR